MRKALLDSAGEFSRSHDAYISEGGGFLIPKNSEFATALRESIADCKRRFGSGSMVPSHKEGNLYNIYLKLTGQMRQLNALECSPSPSPNGRQSPGRAISALREDQEDESACAIRPWMCWSLAEAFIDYLKPWSAVGTDVVDHPIPEGALLAIRQDLDCFATRSMG